MNNISNNITKFNGQYLKCVVSNYTSTKNYLGNSGSLIVIQPKSGKLNDIELENDYKNGNIHRNYVYLGNEFLASGFGFGSQYILEKAENIVNSYDSDIKSLKDKDAQIEDKIAQEVRILNEKLTNYVKIQGGPIDETQITINGQAITTKDIILHGEEARYKNLEIKNINILINNNVCENSTILMPIGSYIQKINVEIEIYKNDSGGIKELSILHNFDEDDQIYEGTKIKYDLDSDILIDSDYSIYKLFYSKQLPKTENNQIDERYVITSYKSEVLKSIYINVAETPAAAYKYYPGLAKLGFYIKSSENAIDENVIDVNKKIDIRPQYYLKYSENGTNIIDTFNNTYLPLNSFSDYDSTVIRFDVNKQMNLNNHIYVAIPSNFSVTKIYMVRNNSEKYNWTGAVSIIRNRKMTCVQTNPINPYYINYDIYILEASNGFYKETDNSTWSVEFDILYNYVKDTVEYDGDYNNLPITNVNITDTIISPSENIEIMESINDEEFNDLYWINYRTLYNTDIISLKNKLDEVSINGAVKDINN